MNIGVGGIDGGWIMRKLFYIFYQNKNKLNNNIKGGIMQIRKECI
jgi:hypothetical protein